MTRHILWVALIAIIGYGFIKAWPLITGPSLSIISPVENYESESGIINVQGVVKRAAFIRLNGAPILHDQNGVFSSTLTFPQGGSILTFTVTDRFGRTVSETRTIFVPTANNQPKTNN